MTMQDFEMKIGAQLTRIEKNPKYFVWAQKWYDKPSEYSYTFYAETEEGKAFWEAQRNINDSHSPGVLIDKLTVSINNHLQEYIIPNSKEVEI